MHPAQKRGRPCEVPGAALCRTRDPCGELPIDCELSRVNAAVREH